MDPINCNETINVEREKANLLCLIKLTLNTLIDQALSVTSLPVLDDRHADVTNFIVTLERVLSFRMRATWLSDRRYFWEFIRPACIGSCRQSIIERVEEVSSNRNLKEKGRIWVKLALMEKKLSELLKLVISDCHLVRKFYYDDSIMVSSQAFILCDQLAGLNGIDFSFCFKNNVPIIAPMLMNDAEIDTIDLTPYLCLRPKLIQQRSQNENNDEANVNTCQMVPMDRYKLEIEQRKYFEELLRHRDCELQKLKARYETLKSERENEIVQMENIILELQLELRAAREEVEMKFRRSQQLNTTMQQSKTFDQLASDSFTTDPVEKKNVNGDDSNIVMNTDDESIVGKIKSMSSPEILSSRTSLSLTSSNDGDELQLQSITTTIVDENTT